MTEDEMVAWHRRHSGHEFEQAPGCDEGQGSLVCCSPCRVGHDLPLNNSLFSSLYLYYFIIADNRELT